jgi:23S rRNA (pseudouridine1915-N3)-methyltransferase
MILLDERGEIWDSLQLSQKLKTPLESGRGVVLVIGGAFGHFPPEMSARANAVWSLSRLVLPHQICRLIVAEQVYRAQEIAHGGKYHHAKVENGAGLRTGAGGWGVSAGGAAD